MAGVWKIEDCYEHVPMCGRSWSRNWNKNTSLATEVVTLLSSFEAVEIGMRRHDEGKITIHTDCRKE